MSISEDELRILELVQAADPANPMSYVHNIVREYSRSKMDQYILGCQDCEIAGKCKTVSRGNANATVMVISESPSEDQVGTDTAQKALDNESGKIMDIVIEKMGVNPDEIFYINAVNCWPHKITGEEIVTRTPNKAEVENCRVFIDYAIQLVQPTVILLLGNIALNLFKKAPITSARGEWIDVKGIPAMPTYHPGYFAKVAGKKSEEAIDLSKWEFYEDVRNTFMYVYENFPENNLIQHPIERGE